MTRISRVLLTGGALAAVLVILPHTAQAGDAKAGADVFAEHCSECHSAAAGKNKKGPSAFGMVGRPAAQVAGFAYSDALRASGITWTPEQLDVYLTLPKKAVPGGKMKFDGLPDARARADVIAYLASLK